MGASGIKSPRLKAKTAVSASINPKNPVKNLMVSEKWMLAGRFRAVKIFGEKTSARAQTVIGKKRAHIP